MLKPAEARRIATLLPGVLLVLTGWGCGPSAARMEPMAGPRGGNTPVTLRGPDFRARAPLSVTFGDEPARSLVVEGRNELTLRTPSIGAVDDAPDEVEVRIHWVDGEVDVLEQRFTYERGGLGSATAR